MKSLFHILQISTCGSTITLPFCVFKTFNWALGPNWAIFRPVKSAVDVNIFYYRGQSEFDNDRQWDENKRNLSPYQFIVNIFTRFPFPPPGFKKQIRAVGFKLFPKHWTGKSEKIFLDW
jgi:hypothetical protein